MKDSTKAFVAAWTATVATGCNLMFHSDAVHADDPELGAARQRALEPLLRATGPDISDGAQVNAMMSWALVHGLVAVAREGALTLEQHELASTLRAVTSRPAESLDDGSGVRRRLVTSVSPAGI